MEQFKWKFKGLFLFLTQFIWLTRTPDRILLGQYYCRMQIENFMSSILKTPCISERGQDWNLTVDLGLVYGISPKTSHQGAIESFSECLGLNVVLEPSLNFFPQAPNLGLLTCDRYRPGYVFLGYHFLSESRLVDPEALIKQNKNLVPSSKVCQFLL